MMRAQRMVSRVGVAVVAVRPCGPVLVAAGACRLSPLRVATANVTGTAAYVLATYFLGQSVADPLDAAVEPLASAPLVPVLVVLVLLVVVWRCCRQRPAAPGRAVARAPTARSGVRSSGEAALDHTCAPVTMPADRHRKFTPSQALVNTAQPG